MAVGSVNGNLYVTGFVPPPQVRWPVQAGDLPAMPASFQDRSGLLDKVAAARRAAPPSVVLTQVLSGWGGVGKTQLARMYAEQELQAGGEVVVVWAAAGDPASVITAYAEAAGQLLLPGVDPTEPETCARMLLRWLRQTHVRWLVVLDDITDLDAIAAWWPTSQAGRGWVIATTRLRDEARLTAGGRQIVPVDVYSSEESRQFLTRRLTECAWAGATKPTPGGEADPVEALAEELGRLPLGLSIAAQYIVTEKVTCQEYLDRFRELALDEVMPGVEEDYRAREARDRRTLTGALTLSLPAAEVSQPAGYAAAAMRLVSVLAPSGHPETLWSTRAIQSWLREHRAPNTAGEVTPVLVRRILLLLHRYGLITHNPESPSRTVTVHALTQRAVLEGYIDRHGGHPSVQALAATAAEALMEVWPEQVLADVFEQAAVLRENVAAVRRRGPAWSEEAGVFPVLFAAGDSLRESGLYAESVSYWEDLTATAEGFLSDAHPDMLSARARLASSYWLVGRFSKAIALQEQALSVAERLRGSEHPDTLSVRSNLATSYLSAGHPNQAISLQEQILTDMERLLGARHPDTLKARSNLATSYLSVGRGREAIPLQEEVLATRERVLGAEHPDTLRVRGNLASSYWSAGRRDEAMSLQESVLSASERVLGAEHPDTLRARSNLAFSYWSAGRCREAIPLQEQVLTSTERVLGAEHPHTLTARSNLASSYRSANRVNEAIRLQEQVLIASERVLGTEHPDTLAAGQALAEMRADAGGQM